jgi:hypothetical protein
MASERDLELLGLIGEQYAVTVPQLSRLIDRRLDTARSLRDRWKRAGWIASGQLLAHAPSFVWLTGKGAALASSPFRVWEPNHGLALHIEAVTEVRLALERDIRPGDWECERAVARQLANRGRRRRHLPDAILHRHHERIAIEVELTLKNRRRLAEIALETSSSYDRVWYFAKPKLVPTLRKIAATNSYGNIDVRSYPTSAADFDL